MAFEEEIGKARTLVEALPYIKRFAGKTVVIKFGGSLLQNERAKSIFANDVVLLKYVGINPVIVHGGGDEITRWTERLGKPAEFVDGMRVTDVETNTIAEMVLVGKLNQEIVTLVNQFGGKAVGLSGKDANLFLAHRKKTKDNRDIGFVGEIEATDVSLLQNLMVQGYIPVLSSVGSSREGESLTVKSDHAAAQIAAALKADKLLFLTNISGILKGGKLLDFLDLADAERLQQDDEVKGGMRSKLQDSIRAIKKGVRSVHIIDGTLDHAVLLEIFTDKGVGSMISNEWMKV